MKTKPVVWSLQRQNRLSLARPRPRPRTCYPDRDSWLLETPQKCQCVPQSIIVGRKISAGLSRAGHEAVLLVQSVEEGVRRKSAGAVEATPLALQGHRKMPSRLGGAGAKGRVWPATIVMHLPRPQGSLQMFLGQRNHPIETLSPKGPGEPFAKRIGLRASYRRLST